MGVLLQATYRRRQGVSVPAPSDGDPNTPWWWDHIASQANALRQAGFTAVLLPPVLKTSAGAYPGGDGYGPFDDYDIGSKQQFFTVPTRFGSREKLQRCVAMLRANGLDVYIDTVPHHRNGGNDFEYRYRGANGTPAEGRFPKHKTCFVPNVPRDPIAGPVRDDFGFGDELAPINAKPPGYVLNGLIDAGDWLTRALDVQGYRIDDVKGLAVEFVRRWLTSKAMVGKFAVGEYFDANPQTLRWWAWDSGMAGRSSVFDFALRFALAAMCNNSSRWDMTQLDHAGLTGHAPLNAVTFVDNPDTDLSSPVVWNKLLGYAYILTAEGYPCVYYKDYATDSGCYGLRRWIDNLIWIHENLAFGPTVTRFKDYQTIVYERQGYPNLLVGLNNDQYHGWRTITAQTGFAGNGPAPRLHRQRPRYLDRRRGKRSDRHTPERERPRLRGLQPRWIHAPLRRRAVTCVTSRAGRCGSRHRAGCQWHEEAGEPSVVRRADHAQCQLRPARRRLAAHHGGRRRCRRPGRRHTRHPELDGRQPCARRHTRRGCALRMAQRPPHCCTAPRTGNHTVRNDDFLPVNPDIRR